MFDFLTSPWTVIFLYAIPCALCLLTGGIEAVREVDWDVFAFAMFVSLIPLVNIVAAIAVVLDYFREDLEPEDWEPYL